MAGTGSANRVVVPGETVATSIARPVGNTYREGGELRSAVVGLYKDGDDRIIPLQGPYLPMIGDFVIGVVQDVRFTSYTLDISSPYTGSLSSKATRDELKLGDVISAVVAAIDESKNITLEEPRRLTGGEIVVISSVKVPRVIGKKNSMLAMLMDATKSEVQVGRNGRIWIKGGNSALAAMAILKIEAEAHTSGLTDRIALFLKEELAKNNR